MNETVKELLGRKLRLWLYLIVALIVLVVGAWQQAEGNTLVFIVALATSLTNILAAANITPPAEQVIAKTPTTDLALALDNRGVTLQDLANLGLHLNVSPEQLPLFGDTPDTGAPPRHSK